MSNTGSSGRAGVDRVVPYAVTIPPATVLERAAELLMDQAAMLQASYTVRGKWPRGSEERQQFKELVRVAHRLQKIDAEVRYD
jgi:hypothetical protein